MFDPRRPIPTIGGNMSSLVGLMPRPAGAAEIPVEDRERARPDVLVWQTAPLPRNVEMTGPITVTLWISSDAPDTDVTAKVVDVYPPTPDYPSGFSMNVTDSILRMRYRNGRSSELLAPGRIYEFSFPLYPTTVVRVAVNTIHHDATHPSRVILPLIDA